MARVTASRHSAAHDEAGTRSVARGGIANLAGAAYSGLATFAITAIVTRIAQPADAGVYFSAISILLIAVALVEVGVPVGYVYLLARYRSTGRTALLRSVLTTGAVPVLGLGVLVVSLALIFREPLGAALIGADVEAHATIVAVLCCGLLAAIVADSLLGATRGFGVMRPTVVADKFVNPTVQLTALLLLALAGWTGGADLVWTRVVGFAAVVIVAAPWLSRLLRRHPSPEGAPARDRWMPRRETVGEFWRFSGPRAIGQFAQVGIQRVDIILIALWVGPVEAAVYAAASRFLIFGQLAANAIGTAVQPRFSALAARNEMGPLQHLYRTSTAWVMFATWPLYLTFIVQAEWLMMVFGADYARGAPVLQLLAAAMLVATACGAVDAVLLMAGRSTWTMINAWVALIVNVGLNVWLIPELGILGATIAWIAAILVNNLVPLVQVRAGLGVHPLGRLTVLAAAIPLLLFGLAPWVVGLLGGGVIGATISFASGVALYLPVLWRLRRELGIAGMLRSRGGARS
ncbi:lipopolysaccharide biosynthesis protein [Microbacterium sp. bgisy189]|uniref:lipopolysaccharide biosynthesis protein n=1 Tax=Microbacterium sp. bgisy189 TaxID=3413798 RepID=UPI003EBC60A8